MNLTFGMFLDGAQWSDGKASLGELRVGPAGMLSFLETRLGLTRPAVHPARRIDEYLRRMESCDGPEMIFHESFQADAWSTAKQMLAWRDELVENGWRGNSDANGSPRLQALAALEQSPLPLNPGRPDRLVEVLSCLRESVAKTKGRCLPLGSVRLVEPPEILPSVWGKIFILLKEASVDVAPVAGSSNHGGETNNLSRAQALLSGRDVVFEGKQDDSLLLIEAENEWELAEHLALWLSSARNDGVAIVCGSDTDLLDRALTRQGLPRPGVSAASPWRAALQILPLVLANVWRPVDLQRLVELLSLPVTPVPRFVARHFLRAVSSEPGIGGVAWDEALRAIADEFVEKAVKKGQVDTEELRGEAEAFAASFDALLAKERWSPEEGIPEEKLKERCRWVVEKLAVRMSLAETEGEFDLVSVLVEVVGQAKEMQRLADGKKYLSRVMVERMLDSVAGTGSAAPDRFGEAAPWQVVTHPGQIAGPVDTLVWWNFCEPATTPPTWWSGVERDSLAKDGVVPEDSGTCRIREAMTWRRALQFTHGRFLMFFPKQKDGTLLARHPFLNEIVGAATRHSKMSDEAIIRALTVRCSELYLPDSGTWHLAGRSRVLCEAQKAELPDLTAEHDVPANAIHPPKSLSYSQMSTMIGCPMKWALRYHAGLRMAETFELPSGNQMIGSLCHRIVQRIYDAKHRPGLDEAAKQAGKLYDELLPSMASELLLEGREIEYRRTREAVVFAVRSLVETVNVLGLGVEATEELLEGRMDDIPFKGYADLLLRAPDGKTFVLDLKWSNSARQRKEEVEEGNALQLATYAWLLRTKEGKGDGSVHTGYFMLKQGEVFSDSPLLRDEALAAERSSEEIWDAGKHSWGEAFRTLQGGVLEAKGVTEAFMRDENGESEEKVRERLKAKSAWQNQVYEAPPCGLCDFGVLCGISGEPS